MTSLIINMPHLQRRRDRQGAMLFSFLCWAWFLMPLVIVASWMLGFHVFAQEIVWLGGWRSLVHLFEIAVTIIAGLAGAWTLWTLAELRTPAARHPATPCVGLSDTAAAFGVEPEAITSALQARVTTVVFDAEGAIVALVPERIGPRGVGVWQPEAAVA